ncbi:MAG: hypothetical protein ACYC91_07370 [Solirubrobacteraceae bacterium]
MSVVRYALGALGVLTITGGLGVAALAIRRRWLSGLDGAPARLAETVIALATLTGILEVLGTLGLFAAIPVLVVSAAGGLLGGRELIRSRRGRNSPPARAAPAARFSESPSLRASLALFPTAVVLALWCAPTLQSYDVGIHTIDSLWYHLPWAASFAQTGQIASLRYTDVEYLTQFYPAGAELVHGLGILLLGRDTLSPAINLVWAGLTLLAAYCIGRPRGRGGATLLGAGLALATPMLDFSQAGSAANDIVGVFFLLAAAALVVNAEGSPAPLALAAIAAGLAISVKLTLLAPVGALTVGVVWLAPAGQRRRRAGRWIWLLLAAGGYWYVRNLLAAGNPLPWLHLPGLATPAAPLQRHTGFSVAHYLGDGHVLSSIFVPGLESGLGAWWPGLLIAGLLGTVLCLATRDRRVRVLGFVAAVSLFAYLITPESAAGPAGSPLGFAFNLRYGAPWLVLALAILPLSRLGGRAGERGGARSAALPAAIVALTLATVAQANMWPTRHLAGMLSLAGGVLIAGACVAVAGRRRRAGHRFGRGSGRVRGGGLAIPATTLVLLAAVPAAGYLWQRHYLRGRYAFSPGVSYLARTWALFRGIQNQRVGVVGTYGGFFSYPLFGADLSNPVQYVAHHGAHASLTPITSCRAWRRAVNAGHYRYVLVTPNRDPWRPRHLSPSPESGWTASDPAARVVYRRQAQGQPIVLYEIRADMTPRACS